METLEKILSETESRSLTAIYEISKILGASLHLEAVLRDVVNILSSYLEMRRAMVVLKGGEDSLRVVAASGATLETLRRGEVIPPERIAVRLFATGMPVVLSSIADSEESGMETSDMPGALDDEVVAEIGVPIRNADHTIGFLAVDRIWSSIRQVRIDTDVRFLTMVANLIGQTVRLHSFGCQRSSAPSARELSPAKSLDAPGAAFV
ncbi:MAG: Nif-specific regulatory protein [Rhodospirillaceae bacterium]|nr:MAG: Nif-specific regulatory protein [Rhodospirillaceae bacterium]